MRATLQAYAADVRAGDVHAAEVFEVAATAFGEAVASFINIWDPARVLILVQERDYAEIIAGTFQAALDAGVAPILRGAPRLRCGRARKPHF